LVSWKAVEKKCSENAALQSFVLFAYFPTSREMPVITAFFNYFSDLASLAIFSNEIYHLNIARDKQVKEPP